MPMIAWSLLTPRMAIVMAFCKESGSTFVRTSNV